MPCMLSFSLVNRELLLPPVVIKTRLTIIRDPPVDKYDGNQVTFAFIMPS